jgi:hypothetical protein
MTTRSIDMTSTALPAAITADWTADWRAIGWAITGDWRAMGWVPKSGLGWLEELREEHTSAVSVWRDAAAAHTALRESTTALHAEYVRGVAEAARANAEPPAVPARLLPEYKQASLEGARDVEMSAQRALFDVVKRVSRAVGAHRHDEEWIGVDELVAFEGQWTWPPVREPGPDPVVVEAEIKAATEECERLTADANLVLRAYRERTWDAEQHGLPRPPEPDLDDTLMARTHALERLQNAIAARDTTGLRRAA